jgi:hypothetical protein
MIAALLSLPALIALLQGCAVDEVCLVSYTSSAEVKPPESQAPAVVRASPFPWDIVLSGASDILTGARKKAIEQKVGYRESRSFTLFRIEAAKSSCRPCAEQAPEAPEQTSGKNGK